MGDVSVCYDIGAAVAKGGRQCPENWFKTPKPNLFFKLPLDKIFLKKRSVTGAAVFMSEKSITNHKP